MRRHLSFLALHRITYSLLIPSSFENNFSTTESGDNLVECLILLEYFLSLPPPQSLLLAPILFLAPYPSDFICIFTQIVLSLDVNIYYRFFFRNDSLFILDCGVGLNG